MMKMNLSNAPLRVVRWIGSAQSIIVHTAFFISSFFFIIFGIPIEKILLILTTLVSLEAIYLSIFIQISINKNTESIGEIQDKIEDVQEDIEEIKDEDEDAGL